MSRSGSTAHSGGHPAKRRPGRPSGNDPVMAREALVRSALTVFSQKGFEAASVRFIASAGGVDPGLVRHHFGSKQDLWNEVARYLAGIFKGRRDRLLASLSESPPGIREALELIISEFVQFSAELPELGMFISNEATTNGERIDYIVEQLIRPFYQDFLPLVKTGIEDGVLAAQNPKLFFFTLVHAVSMPMAFPGLLNQFPGAKVGSPTFNRQLKETILATFIVNR